MRAALACLVLAAAIATPGVVVAAMSSGGQATSFFAGSTTSAIATPIQTIPARTAPIDPALRPAVDAVMQAFAAKGIHLVVEPSGPRSAEAFNFTASSSCPTFVRFYDERNSLDAFGSSCPTAKLLLNDIKIIYGPPSIGPIVRQAVADLR